MRGFLFPPAPVVSDIDAHARSSHPVDVWSRRVFCPPCGGYDFERVAQRPPPPAFISSHRSSFAWSCQGLKRAGQSEHLPRSVVTRVLKDQPILFIVTSSYACTRHMSTWHPQIANLFVRGLPNVYGVETYATQQRAGTRRAAGATFPPMTKALTIRQAKAHIKGGRPPASDVAAYHRWRRARITLGLPTCHEFKLSDEMRAYFRARKAKAKASARR
jgi:hypothetical protein